MRISSVRIENFRSFKDEKIPFNDYAWHCHTNLSRPAKGAGLKRSGRQLTPFRECGSAVLLEDVATVEVTIVVEVVVD